MIFSHHKSISAILSGIAAMRPAAMALFAAWALLGALSCSETADSPVPAPPAPPAEEEPSQVHAALTLTVNSGALPAISRAPVTLGPDYDAGSGYENYIDLDNFDFRFYFFGPDNKYLAGFEVSSIVPLESSTSSKRYLVSGSAERALIDSGTTRLMVLANWKTYPADSSLRPGVTTIDDLCSQLYDFAPSMMELSEENTIPLYGITNPLPASADAAGKVDFGKVHLLRAYAKIEVCRNESGFEIENVRLHRYNTRGYCAPTGIYAQDDYVHNDYDLDYANTPHVPASSMADKELPFIRINADRYVAYVPEFDNLSNPSARATIRIRFSAFDTDDVLEFKYYHDPENPSNPNVGKHFNILRNYWYRFIVRKRGVLVQVVPYSEVLLNPVFGLGNHLELVEVRIGDEKYYYDRETGKYYTESLVPIDNPFFLDTDPVTGWNISRDSNNAMIGYYDSKTGQAYALNKITPILDPRNIVDSENHDLMVVASSEFDHIYYYHNNKTSLLYGTDRSTTILNPFDYFDAKDNRIRYVSSDRKFTFGYYSIKERQWLAPDITTPILDPFLHIDPDTERVGFIAADGSSVYGYYDRKEGKWYDAPSGGSVITKPF